MAKRTALSSEQKAAGRRFLAVAQAQLTALVLSEPPTHRPPSFVAIYRHPCPQRKNVSTALQLHEVYVSSSAPIPPPEEHLLPDGIPDAVRDDVLANGWPGGDDTFAFIYRVGECRFCHEKATSPAGLLAIASDRPPTQGRMARTGS